jgi:hypothetical protein
MFQYGIITYVISLILPGKPVYFPQTSVSENHCWFCKDLFSWDSQHFTQSTLQVHFKYTTSTFQVHYKCTTSTLQVQYQYTTSTLQLHDC